MSHFSELNRVLLDHAITLIKEGNYSKARNLGFSDQQLRTLNMLKAWDVSELIKSAPALVRLSVDSEVFEGVLRRLNGDEGREQLIDECLLAGASVQMMAEFFGMSGNDTSTRRQLLGIEPRQGRLCQPTEEQEHAVYNQWRKEAGDEDPAHNLEAMLRVAQTQSLPLATVWMLVKGWYAVAPR